MAAVIGAPKSSDGNQPGADITQPDGWSTAEGAVRIRPQPSAVHATDLSLLAALALPAKSALQILDRSDQSGLCRNMLPWHTAHTFIKPSQPKA